MSRQLSRKALAHRVGQLVAPSGWQLLGDVPDSFGGYVFGRRTRLELVGLNRTGFRGDTADWIQAASELT